MMMFSAKNTLRQIHAVLKNRGGGINKRLDENRELLELLRSDAPNFLATHPWVEGWLSSNNDFLTSLDAAAGPHENLFQYTRRQNG